METVLPYKWPLALDILKRQYDALPDQHLLAFQSPFIEKMPNMKLHLLGNVGYMTTDPKNVEAILQTNFEGANRCHITSISSVKLTWWLPPPRLGSWFSKGGSLSATRWGYFYSRRSSLEAFSRNASPTIRPYRLQEPKYFRRACQRSSGESTRVNWCGWSATIFLPVHSCHHHCTHLRRTCRWSWRWRSQHLFQLVRLCIKD